MDALYEGVGPLVNLVLNHICGSKYDFKSHIHHFYRQEELMKSRLLLPYSDDPMKSLP